jgi:hypothetical protein
VKEDNEEEKNKVYSKRIGKSGAFDYLKRSFLSFVVDFFIEKESIRRRRRYPVRTMSKRFSVSFMPHFIF